MICVAASVARRRGRYALTVRSPLPLVAALIVMAGCRDRSSRPRPAPVDAALVTPADATPSGDPSLDAWRADLATVVETLVRRHPAPFHYTPEPAFRAAVAAFERALPTLTREQRIAGLAQIVALIHDGHTQVFLDGFERLLRLPIEVRWFRDAAIVTAAAPAHAWAIGGRVTAVGGQPIAVAADRLTATVGFQADGFRRERLGERVTSVVFLRGVGLAPPDGPARFEVVDRAGVVRPLEVEIGPLPPSAAGADAPLRRQEGGRYYWSRYLPDADAVYLSYRRCNPDPRQAMAELVAEVGASLAAHPRARLVVDLRDNGGGDSTVLAPLYDVLEAHPHVRIAALIGPATFSSGITAAIDLDRRGALLIGEPAGSPATMYGQTTTDKLPGARLKLQYSTRTYTFADYPGPALAPEVEIVLGADDHLAGRDPALAHALTTALPAR